MTPYMRTKMKKLEETIYTDISTKIKKWNIPGKMIGTPGKHVARIIIGEDSKKVIYLYDIMNKRAKSANAVDAFLYGFNETRSGSLGIEFSNPEEATFPYFVLGNNIVRRLKHNGLLIRVPA